jgi:uridine phosphorylase
VPDAIVFPKKGRKDPTIGPVVVMVAMQKDLTLMRRTMDIPGKAVSSIATSKLYRRKDSDQEVTLVGPMLGAPHAVLVLENLIVLGAKKILFFGWCGSLHKSVKNGDWLCPDRAVIGEGTSMYYPSRNEDTRPSSNVFKAIMEGLEGCSTPCHTGPVWSTDAPYRETRQKILSLQKEGVIGVDMEVSALFSAAQFRHVECGALLVVSDELGSLRWKPGFSSIKFNRSRKKAAEVVSSICDKLIKKNDYY